MMKKRFVKRFQNSMGKFAEDILNNYLENNPNYRLVAMTYANQGTFYYGIIAYFEEI